MKFLDQWECCLFMSPKPATKLFQAEIMPNSLHFPENEWLSCCGSSKFAKEMVKIGPFETVSEAIETSRQIWWNKVDVPGWLEAFASHPRIGDLKSLSSKSNANPEWCEGEQSTALHSANDLTLKELAEWNRLYESKFGFVFLVCATGKSSSEILQLLKGRFNNRPLVELEVAANEQQRITELRIAKLVNETRLYNQPSREVPPSLPHGAVTNPTVPGDAKTDDRLNKLEAHVTGNQPLALRPPITTHILDVSLGKPAAEVEVSLEYLKDASNASGWIHVGTSVTNQDGRSGALMQPSDRVDAGKYKLTFNTGKYHSSANTPSFYPFVSIVFEIKPSQVSQHFHVPLLLSPFGYSTYRGS